MAGRRPGRACSGPEQGLSGLLVGHGDVVEDAEAGVTAAIDGGMSCLAVGFASADPRADYSAEGLQNISPECCGLIKTEEA